jgi:hypothetical protein
MFWALSLSPQYLLCKFSVACEWKRGRQGMFTVVSVESDGAMGSERASRHLECLGQLLIGLLAVLRR